MLLQGAGVLAVERHFNPAPGLQRFGAGCVPVRSALLLSTALPSFPSAHLQLAGALGEEMA